VRSKSYSSIHGSKIAISLGMKLNSKDFRILIPSLGSLILLIFFAVVPVFASSPLSWCRSLFGKGEPRSVEELSKSQAVLYGFMNRTAERPLLDTSPENMSRAMNELRTLFLSTPAAEFNHLWKNVSKKDFKVLYTLITEKVIPATELQFLRVTALKKLIDEGGGRVFWNRDSPWDALLTHHPEMRGPGYRNDLGGVIAGVDTHAMTELQREVVDAARGKDSRVGRGNWFQRMVKHPMYVARRIVTFNDQVRLRLEHLDGLRSLIEAEFAEEAQLGAKFQKEDLERIQGILTQVQHERRGVISDLERAYGQDITTGGVIVIPKDIDIYVIAENIKKKNLVQSDQNGSFVQNSEGLIKELNDIFQAARKRSGLPDRTEWDMHAVELRIRHLKFLRESIDADAKWDSVMAKGSGHKVFLEYHWTETEVYTVTVSDGKGGTRTETRTRQVTRYGSSYVEVSYREILEDRLSEYEISNLVTVGGQTVTIDSVSGKEKILSGSQEMAGLEKDLYQTSALLSYVSTQLTEHHKILLESEVSREILAKELQEAENLRVQVIETIERLESHAQKTDSQILKVWSGDSPQHFRVRNEALKKALINLREYLETYQVQLNGKEFELTVQADVMDHTADFRILKFKAFAQYTLQGVTALGTGALSLHYFTDPQFKSYVDGLWEAMKAFIQ
jgi:hypothetical protein